MTFKSQIILKKPSAYSDFTIFSIAQAVFDLEKQILLCDMHYSTVKIALKVELNGTKIIIVENCKYDDTFLIFTKRRRVAF